jgi:cell division GTPase FtsZ
VNEANEVDLIVPDIPMPPEVDAAQGEVKDETDAAFKFAFIGSGQGGSRLAQTFFKLGYRRVCAINTAEQDLATIDLPNKLLIGNGGAGKDPKLAKSLLEARKEDVLDFMSRSFGPVFDRIFVCVGAGGGTGAGTVLDLVDTAAELQESLKIKSKVGVVVALPKNSEGARVCHNAYWTLHYLTDLVEKGVVSPLIIIDNEKISTIFPGLAVDPFWNTANSSVCSLFHLFNSISVKHSRYSSFDANDFKLVLDSGLIVFGASPLKKWETATDISSAVRDNLKRNILSGGVDLGTGSVAGVVIIGGKEVMEKIPQEFLDHAFDQFTRTLKSGSTVHRGIYCGDKPTLVAYTAIGGLSRPVPRLEELKKLGNVTLGNPTPTWP